LKQGLLKNDINHIIPLSSCNSYSTKSEWTCNLNHNKHMKVKSTLQWPPLGCHITLLSKDTHVWVYPTSNFWKNFIMFCILCYNITQERYCKRKYFISFYKMENWSIFVETNVVYLCTKTQIYSQKHLNDFESLWKLKVYLTISIIIVWIMLDIV
jgi:hypothetical protein